MTDAENPAPAPNLDWQSAPDQFRSAHDKLQETHKSTAAEREQLARENAMLKAGVDAEHPAYSYFEAGYKGELTPDDIKAEWAKISGTQQTPPPTTEQPTGQPQPAPPQGLTPAQEQQLRDLQDVQSRLSGSSVAPGEEPTPDPMDTALATFHATRAEGGNQTQAMRKAFQVIFDAAAAGDGRIAFGSQAESMEAWKRKRGWD